MMRVELGENSYDIIIKRGALGEVEKYFDLDRKVLVVTDDNVPQTYAETVLSKSKQPYKAVFENGEKSKNIDTLQKILDRLTDAGFARGDCIVAVGGGVAGDMAGFAAAIYMRGIDFYNVPTTVLSQVDSSIGGKTAIDYRGIKNVIGAFKQPKCVLIDPDTLKTLPRRQINNGLFEALKMAATSDKELFDLFERGDIYGSLDIITEKSLLIKKSVVEQDEKENGLRKVLNFGHTLGHGIESALSPMLYHGECVALGMLAMSSKDVKNRLLKIYEKMGFSEYPAFDADKVMEAVAHDKKGKGGAVTAVVVREPGKFEFETMDLIQLRKRTEELLCEIR